MRRSNSGRSLDLEAFRFLLAFAVILFFSSNTLAQHGSGGGGSSGGGGGGSHGGGSSGGGSSSSGGGHSSGGSGSSGSGGHSSGGHVSSGHGSATSPSYSVRGPNAEMRGKTGTEKRGFFSTLRHPFRKPQPKPDEKLTADLRRPICFRGPCAMCPTGIARGGGCGGTVVATYARRSCAGGVWNGGACFQQSRFPYDCNAERVAMEQQAQRMHAAEAAQQSACSTGSGQDCSDRTSVSQNETSAYRTLQAQYQACQQRSIGVNPFGHSISGHSQGLSSGPLNFDLEYR
jgi:hypothetical protein